MKENIEIEMSTSIEVVIVLKRAIARAQDDHRWATKNCPDSILCELYKKNIDRAEKALSDFQQAVANCHSLHTV